MLFVPLIAPNLFDETLRQLARYFMCYFFNRGVEHFSRKLSKRDTKICGVCRTCPGSLMSIRMPSSAWMASLPVLDFLAVETFRAAMRLEGL